MAAATRGDARRAASQCSENLKRLAGALWPPTPKSEALMGCRRLAAESLIIGRGASTPARIGMSIAP